MARSLFPQAPEPWIDLSTGINPHAYPLPAIDEGSWRRLPGRAEEDALLCAARIRYRVPPSHEVLAAPGTQCLIDLMPRVHRSGRVAVVGPSTYAEHQAAWARSGSAVEIVPDCEQADPKGVTVVVNPNNPDGRIVPPGDLARHAQATARLGGLLIVDEAFADLEPDVSIVPHAFARTLVLRSFGKTYGLAGLRLGFAIGAREVVAPLAVERGPWAVSGPALVVGEAALRDEDWLARQAQARRADAERLDDHLRRVGRIVGGTVLYRLVETEAGPDLFAALGSAGIYVRRFADRPDRLRFGLPGDATAWARLDAVLSAFARRSAA